MIPTVRRILTEVKPQTKKVVIIALTGLIYSAAYARLILILKDLSEGFERGQQNKVADVAILAFSLALIVAVSRYFHIYLMNYLAEIIANSYRTRLQQKFMNLSLSFHSNFAAGAGGLLSRILNDIRVIQDGLRMLADFFREPLLAILLLGNLFYLNWRLTFSILILLPIVLVFLRQISRSLRKYVLFGQENLDRVTSTIKESLDGIRIIQSFNLEHEMHQRLKNQTDQYIEIRRKVHSRIEMMGPVTELLATALILGIFFYFSVEVAKGTTSVGAVLAYTASMLAINQPIKKFQESYVRIQETIVAATRVYAVLDERNEVPAAPNPQPFPHDWKKIVYKDVSFSYGQDLILKNVSLEIKRGEKVAFVGESGSGKSTIVNLLERFYDPTSGQILIDDIPIQSLDLKSLRAHVALVTQDVFLFNDSIERNIQAGDFSKDLSGIEDVAKSANAHDFILRLPNGYQSYVGERGSLLSGGEKQRISIARAFFKDAPVLILDEATSALDTASEVEVQKGLDSLAKGRTSLIIAHRLSTIQDADRIYVIKSGSLVEMGRHAELILLGGEYARFHQMQNRAAT
ncbi:MAG: ABC transporter ATP-binding protein [Bdellovibrionaceae bacterium]|nr:ABC transporter ATP-binding protein [Pseudobdellovibrionaceae bacterium]